MDPISYGVAAKQKQRIEKVIAEPDSTCGVITVPQVIATGETITVPAGRTAVLPNVQVDGTLNVQGDVFIPSGATMSKVVEKVASTDNAIVRFNGATGDVQNSGVIIDDNNNVTQNGTSSSQFSLNVGGSLKGWLYSGTSGTALASADYLTFNTNNTEKMRIDANGNIGVGVTPSAWHYTTKSIDIGTVVNSGSFYSSVGINHSHVAMGANHYYDSSFIPRYKGSNQASKYEQALGGHKWQTAPIGTAGDTITWNTAMTLDSSGTLMVGASTAGTGNTSGFNVTNPTNTTYCSIGHINGSTAGNAYLSFSYNGTAIGSVYQSGTTSVVFQTTSDYRLKENVRPADCKRFMDIKFVDYERIDGIHECGVIAHELKEIYPDLVTGEKDATEIRKVEVSPAVEEVKDEDGNIITEAVEAVYEEQEFPVYQQVNYMGLIARIGTVVQQQQQMIDALKARVEVLEAK